MKVFPLAIVIFFIWNTYVHKKDNSEPSYYDSEDGKTWVFTFEPDWKNYLVSIASNPNDIKFLTALNETEKQITSENNADFIPAFAHNYKRLYPDDNFALQFSDVIQTLPLSSPTFDSVVFYLTEHAKNDLLSTKNILIARADNMKMPARETTMELGLNNFTFEFEHLANMNGFRKGLLTSADVSFWEMYTPADISDAIVRADDALAAESSNTVKTKVNKAIRDSDITSADDFRMENTEYPIRKYLLGGFEGSSQSSNASLSYVYEKDTAELIKVLNHPSAKKVFPSDAVFCFGKAGDEVRREAKVCILYCKKMPPNGRPYLSGRDIEDADMNEDKYNHMPVVNVKMNASGAERWEDMTRNNIRKPIGILINNFIVSAPTPNEAIKGGTSSITGAFTKQEAYDISIQIKMGVCPVKVRILNQAIR